MLKSNAENMEKEFLERLNQHRGIIYRISKVYMPDASERKDLVQEMVLQLWKSYATFKGDSSFSTWMYKVCLNTALTYVRGFLKHRDKHSEIRIDLAYEDEGKEEKEKINQLYKIIYQLNEVDKALIFLYLEDMPGKDIALSMGISEVNARVKLNRIKEKIRQQFKNSGHEL